MSQSLSADLRHAARSLAKRPAFTALAAGILALGIGANTAIFSVAYGVLLKPLPYAEPEGLVHLWPGMVVDKMMAEAVSERMETIAAVSPGSGWLLPLTGEGEPEMVDGAKVGRRHFQMLGVEPLLGRAFAPEEGRPGHHRVAVLDHGLWQRRYGGDPGIVGRSIDVDGEPHTVVGVMPADFQPLVAGRELWLPVPVDPGDEEDFLSSFYLTLVGRLAPGASAAAAQAELQGLVRALAREHPQVVNQDWIDGARVVPLQETLVGEMRPVLLVLLGAVGFVLLIACANVANLMLVRATGRRREMAVRAAVGAGRARIARLLLVESLLLGLAGGAAALLAASWCVEAMVAALPGDMPRTAEIGIDGAVLAFNLAVSVVAALLFGLAPARSTSRVDLASDLKEDGAGGSGGRRGRRTGQLLVAGQVAAATVLLIVAGLLLRSLWRMGKVDPGFSKQGVLAVQVAPPESRYRERADKVEYYRRVLEEVLAVPGVVEAGGIQLLPLTGGNWSFPYLAEGHPVPEDAPPGTPLPAANFRVVTTGYFRSMGIPLLSGRGFTPEDASGAAQVGLVNRTLAEELWPGGGALGKSIRLFGDEGPRFTVVGIVGDVRQHRLDTEPAPEIYRPHAQWPLALMYLMVRTQGRPAAVAPALRAAIWRVDGDVPVAEMRPVEEVLRSAVAEERFTGLLVAAFAGLALVLGMVGVYGVASYAAARRTREIGIRMALGARRWDVLGEVLGQGVVMAGGGLGVGVLVALGLSRLLASRLYGVSPMDAVTLGGVALVVLVASVASTWLPAWRASGIEPSSALRRE